MPEIELTIWMDNCIPFSPSDPAFTLFLTCNNKDMKGKERNRKRK